MTAAPRSWATLPKQLHHLPSAMAVERGGGFVGQNQARLVGQRAGHGDALLLAAGKRVGQIVGAIGDAEIIEQFHRAFVRGARRCVVDLQRHLHVLDGGQKRNQIRLLENKAEMLAAESPHVHLGLVGVHDPFPPM